jgi:hypothetical protein
MPRVWNRILIALIAAVLCFTGTAFGAEAPGLVGTQELLFGNGTEGPFPLSWTKVRIGSEQITVNGTRLRLGLDYLLDFETGAVTFVQPLRRDQIAQVEYVYDSASAKQNHAPAQVPLSMRVLGGGGSGLQMIGSVRPAATPNGAPTASLLGFRGDTTLGGGKLSSLFLLAPEANSGAQASAWQTAALRFGASREAGAFKFSGSFGQAGAGFRQAKEYQLQQGLRVMDFAAAFDPSKRVSFSSQVSRQEALDAASRAKEQTRLLNQLTLTPSDGTKLTLTQESATKARAGGKDETLDALRAQVQQKIGGQVTATALAEQQRTDAGGTSLTTGVGLDAQAAPQLRLRTDLSRRESEKDGRTDSLRVGVQAGSEKKVALSGEYRQALAEKTGADTTTGLRLTARPAERLGVNVGFRQRLTEQQGHEVGSDVGLTAGRNGLVKVERQVLEKSAPQGPGQQTEQLRVETSPLKGVKVATLRASTQVGDEAARDTRETSLELAPVPGLKVAGALRDQEVADGVAHVRSVSGSVAPARYLDVSGAYKTREMPLGDALITRDLRLCLNPLRGLKLHGGYTENPEDKEGRVLDTTHTTVGLESTIGSLMFGGSYTTGLAEAAARETEQAEVRLALNLWGNTRFTSAYKTSEERAGSVTQGRTLSLGFTRSLSSSFYLMLEGELSQVQVNGVPQPGLSDQRAQAKLGLRF